MNYSPIQLEAIRIFGKKDLTFGCLIKYGDAILQYSHEGASCHIFVNGKETGAVEKGKEEYIEILGHIPHLEDIFRVAEEKGFTFDLINFGTKQPRLTSLIPSNENLNVPYNPTLPLLEQDESTLKELINLFEK